jgi:hypothetical protein
MEFTTPHNRLATAPSSHRLPPQSVVGVDFGSMDPARLSVASRGEWDGVRVERVLM